MVGVLADVVGFLLQFYALDHGALVLVQPLLVSGLLFAAAAFMVQQGANAYQEARYPGRQPRGMTTGEVIATVIGVIIFALSIVGAVVGG